MSISQHATSLRKILGPLTRFFVYDPYMEAEYFYRFTDLGNETIEFSFAIENPGDFDKI
jgi:hypothetical protein